MVILLVVEDPIMKTNVQSSVPPGTNVHQNGEYFRRGIHIDLMYFKTLPGILKIIQFVVILILKVLPTPPYLDFVVQLTFILTSIWIWVYVFSLTEKYTITPTWLDLEFFYMVGATFLYVIMTIIAFSDYSVYLRAAVFGLLNSVAFGLGTFILFKEWQAFRQVRVATTQQATPTSGPPNNAGYI